MAWKKRSLFFVTLIVVAAASATAVADGDELSEDVIDEEDIERAQEAFEKGAAHYYEEEYGRAMVEFRRANERHPHPIFQHNIALSNRQLGRLDRTLEAAEAAAAMDEALPAPADATNSGLIVGIQSVFRSQEMADELAPDTDEPAVADADEAEQVEPMPDIDDSSWGIKGFAGVGSLALGLAGLTGAMIVDRQIVSGMDSLENDNWEEREDFDDKKGSLKSRQSLGQGFLFSGAGLTVLGAGLVTWELMSGPTDSGVALSPSMHRPGMDVMWRW